MNFTGANLSGADLTDCSLNGTSFNDADLKDVQFGQQPYLEHIDAIRFMASNSIYQQLASIDSQFLYLWNLETFKLEKQPLWAGQRPFREHLFFSHDGR